MKVLIGCEESQTVCKAFRAKGHEAYSCDIQECSGGHPEWHFNMDIFQVIKGGELTTQSGDKVIIDKWDSGIFHPPCTYISFVGNRWFNIQRYGEKAIQRMKNRDDAIQFFLALWNCDIPKLCLENPRGYIQKVLPQTQIIQPYYFGDSYSKTTCLWLKGLPKLYHNKQVNLFDQKVTHVWKGEMHRKNGGAWHNTNEILAMPQAERSKARSKTFPGIANAMAEQWG